MHKHTILYNNFLYYLFFIATLIISFFIFRDYGISIDEEFHRNNGLFYYNYIKSFFGNSGTLDTEYYRELISNNNVKGDSLHTVPSFQPIVFDFIGEVFIDIFNLKSTKQIYELRHYLNFIIFYIGLIFFYKIIFNQYKSNLLSLLGVLLIFLSPRFFAESFYNSKDIFFLSITIINTYYALLFIKKPNYKYTLFFSLTSSLLINTRIMGIISISIIYLIIFLKSTRNNFYFKKNIKFFLISVFLSILIIFLTWPFLWQDPINHFIFGFNNLIGVNFSITSLYFGDLILSKNAPWHYIFVWIIATSPTIVLLLFLLGFFSKLKRLFTRLNSLDDKSELISNDIWKSENELKNIYFLLMVFVPVALFIHKGVAYDGWRLLYFIYPFIILIGIFGIYNFNIFFKNKFLKNLIYFFIIVNLINLLFWNYRNHPNQQVFFNFFFKKNFNQKFEMDYWGVTNTQSLKYIINNNQTFPVSVATISLANLETSSFILDDEEKKKIFITYNIPDADFIITNYRNKQKISFQLDKKIYEKYYEILVDNIPINTIFKKIK